MYYSFFATWDMRVSSTYTYNAQTREARRTIGDFVFQIDYFALSRGLGASAVEEVDIVTDTLHATSSDLITRNTLAMVRMELQGFIPQAWHEIAAASLAALEESHRQEPFLPDKRRGYARVKPVGLTSTGKAAQLMLSLDQYPMHGLGFCDEKESSEHFETYPWSGWSKKEAQPMQVDQDILDMLGGPDRGSANTGGSTQSVKGVQDVNMSDPTSKRK